LIVIRITSSQKGLCSIILFYLDKTIGSLRSNCGGAKLDPRDDSGNSSATGAKACIRGRRRHGRLYARGALG
jgi:hypothetical protein